MRTVLETVAGNPENQDRGAVIESSAGLVLVVADGAGGLSGGAEAAAMVVEFVRRNASEIQDPDSCVLLLQQIDQGIAKDDAAGETTCSLVVVGGDRIYGASVGDSGVWVIGESGFADLTKGQSRKPFLGSGTAWPMPLTHERMRGDRLLLATDGLLKYTSSDRSVAACCNHDYDEAALRLIELVRYPSGTLPDDVTVILAQL